MKSYFYSQLSILLCLQMMPISAALAQEPQTSPSTLSVKVVSMGGFGAGK